MTPPIPPRVVHSASLPPRRSALERRWPSPWRQNWRTCAALLWLAGALFEIVLGQIPKPKDAPQPLSPSASQHAFQVAAGFRIELLASEPLVTEPTGVCWDEHGHLYVCELHGYNLEGQLEIEAMNQSGVLDTKVQRVQAAERFKEQAALATYGVVKRLSDQDRDGRMDTVQVLASNLPPAYGICPARGGLIVAGQAEILFLADRDGDGVAEVRQTLFQGWKSGALERGINAPQWGPDGWIYLGRGWGSTRITGPHLGEPVDLPNTDFRIRADGTAIEPVGAGTHTIGLAFAADGTRFFTTTWKHALYAVPIAWRYLARNPDAAAPSLEADASDYTTVYPIAPVHPWRQARSSQPGWKELYAAYGVAESAASGYFTSCCSPLVYQSAAFPAEYQGNLLVCEPAQSLVHRSLIESDGPGYRVRRPASEIKREFLASSDSWFRPVSLAHAPDGSVVIVDMYREIIEDYSAVPRYLQQQYGLQGGVHHGRLWRLSYAGDQSPSASPDSGPADLSALDETALAAQLDSPNFWRRQTAARLLQERFGDNAPALVSRRGTLEDALRILRSAARPPGLNSSHHSSAALESRLLELLRTHDQSLRTDASAARQLASLVGTVRSPRLLLQLALSLGYSPEPEAFEALAYLARERGHVRWMPAALLTGMHQRAGRLLTELLQDPGPQGHLLLEPLAAAVAAGRNPRELEAALEAIANSLSDAHRATCLKGLQRARLNTALPPAAAGALQRLLTSESPAVTGLAAAVAGALGIAAPPALAARLDQAARQAADSSLAAEQRLAAIALLATAEDATAAPALLAAWPSATPLVRTALLDALLHRGPRLSAFVDALEKGEISPASLSDVQRARLLERADSHRRPRLETIFAQVKRPAFAPLYQRYVAALDGPRDLTRGAALFQQLCATCHRVGELGTDVGPNLSQAFQRSEETLVHDVLAPSDSISSGYETYRIALQDGEELSGILISDSASSITLRLGGGLEQTVLRKDLARVTSSPVSLMPDGLEEVLTPADCASLLSWIRAALLQGR